ncbi:MAG: D-glycero-beta-D-manno-heptose-7-phosphate kinase [Campylobacterota bacterium]
MQNKPNILVIGDLMLDAYLWGSCNRVSPEAPVQIIDIDYETLNLGGAGNVINNLNSLNSNVTAISVVGEDKNSFELEKLLKVKCSDYFLIKEAKRVTTKKTRIIATNSQVVRFDNENIKNIKKSSVNTILDKVKDAIQNIDIVILSDYNKGVLTNKLTKKIIEIANKNSVKVVVDPKGKSFDKYKNAYLLTPNKKEAQEILKEELNSKKSLKKLFKYLRKDLNIDIPLVTLSQNGIAYQVGTEIINKPTYAKEVFDVTGAGDTIIATLSYFIAQKYSLNDSIEYANKAAGIVVGKIGCATATLEEIFEEKSSSDEFEGKLKDKVSLLDVVKKAKEEDKKIVFTNGCFDILHKGHVKYLKEAKKLGDILIIGLNSDESVKRLKGENRPINDVNDRAYMLSSYSFVDYIAIFAEDTPLELIKSIFPDVLVKGEDYKNRDIVGSTLVNEVKLIKFEKGRSTTLIIDKIKTRLIND